jgi:selenocysteine lyase/cysteine desulfurase
VFHVWKTEEIVFTRGTTEAINLVASSFCESQMQAGDEVLVTEMEHHSNIVSWQLQAQKRGIVVKHLPITDDGRLDLSLLTFSPLMKDAVVSFNVGNIHHLDMGTLLDRLGIAVRTGHHCAQPLMDRLGISGTVRASFALYNTKEEIDTLVAGIRRVSQMF